jgi:hypothetical protein
MSNNIISNYEKLRNANILRNELFLESLKVPKLNNVISTGGRTSTSTEILKLKCSKKDRLENEFQQPPRKSIRLLPLADEICDNNKVIENEFHEKIDTIKLRQFIFNNNKDHSTLITDIVSLVKISTLAPLIVVF